MDWIAQEILNQWKRAGGLCKLAAELVADELERAQRRVRVKYIVLERSEGRIDEVEKPVAVKTFQEANEVLAQWARTAPPKGHGYDKTGFLVIWEDGETYEGRYDLQCNVPLDLAGHIRDFLRFHAGQWQGNFDSEEAYLAYLDLCEQRLPGIRQKSAEVLERYQLE